MKKRTKSNQIKIMKRAAGIYTSKEPLAVLDKWNEGPKKLSKPGMTSSGNTSMLFNYQADMLKCKEVPLLIKNLKLKSTDSEPDQVQKSKTGKSKYFMNNIALGITIILFMLFMTSCARKATFQTSSVVPAAQGTVKVKTDNNKNYVIDVQIKDLADVSRLQPPKESYVVWMETEQGKTEKLGQLLSSKSFLSKQMTADLQTVSSYKPVKIFVTAENGSNVQYPDRKVVLTTERF